MRCFRLLAAEHSDSLKPVDRERASFGSHFQERLMHDPRIKCPLDCLSEAAAMLSPKTPKRAGEDTGDKPGPKKPRSNPSKAHSSDAS